MHQPAPNAIDLLASTNADAPPAASMTEAAYRLIKQAILRCELAPGQKVSEEQLADRFALGRAAVRPALKRLYQEQLVQTITRNRYVISGLTRWRHGSNPAPPHLTTSRRPGDPD